MKKYNVEGEIDFYAELYKSLDIEDTLEEDVNVCLITNQPLTDKHVIMECGHKFNYIPIYKDIVNHKNKFNVLEGGNGKLNTNQIRCPYCRNKQYKLLPYYEDLNLPKVNGVNVYDTNIKQTNHKHENHKHEKCAFKYMNNNYDPNMPETNDNVKYIPNLKCYFYGSQIQLYNSENVLQPIDYGDNNCYCHSHKKVMIKHYKAEAKQKAKEDAKAAKQKAKEDAKFNKNKQVENVVLGPSNVFLEPNGGCMAILKSGPNKGKHCGCKITDEVFCGRHIKTAHNIIINN